MGIEGIENLTSSNSASEFVVTESSLPVYPNSANRTFACNPDESLGMADEVDEDTDEDE